MQGRVSLQFGCLRPGLLIGANMVDGGESAD